MSVDDVMREDGITGELREYSNGWQFGRKEDWLWIPSNSEDSYKGRQPQQEFEKRVETRKSATRKADI
jgi:hypothetical protein